MMKTISKIVILVMAVVFSACQSRELNTKTSFQTGWKTFDNKTVRFEAYQTITSPIPTGMLPISGGTFTIGQMDEFITAPRNNQRRSLTVSPFYMDKYEVTNIAWREYVQWMEYVFGKVNPELAKATLPDTTVWRDEMAYNDPMVENYFRHPAYSFYPVVGVSWDQAMAYCQWRTDRVNELALVSGKYIEQLPYAYLNHNFCFTEEDIDAFLLNNPKHPEYKVYNKQTVKVPLEVAVANGYKGEAQEDGMVTMYQLPYEWIRNQFVFNTEKYLYTNYLPLGHKGRKINMSDNVLLIGYRLPTEAEWEYAALGQQAIGGDMGMIEQNQIYPWLGYQTRSLAKGVKRNPIKSKANFVGARGDMTGGTSNDGGVVTTPVDAYTTNGFGLYNMAGNVNEWVLDVYRETTHEEVIEYNAFRGNVYTRIKRDAAGNAVLDAFGAVEREYDMVDDKRNYKDGDEGSLFETDYPLDTTNLTAEQMENVKYDPTDVLAPLVNSETRVYKGGSWNDRIYWLEPATRRYLDQKKSSSTIGFRCAMSKLGE